MEAVGNVVEQVAIDGNKQVNLFDVGKNFVGGAISSGVSQAVLGKVNKLLPDDFKFMKGLEDVASRSGAVDCVKKQLDRAIEIGCQSKIGKMTARLADNVTEYGWTVVKYTATELIGGVVDNAGNDPIKNSLESAVCNAFA